MAEWYQQLPTLLDDYSSVCSRETTMTGVNTLLKENLCIYLQFAAHPLADTEHLRCGLLASLKGCLHAGVDGCMRRLPRKKHNVGHRRRQCLPDNTVNKGSLQERSEICMSNLYMLGKRRNRDRMPACPQDVHPEKGRSMRRLCRDCEPNPPHVRAHMHWSPGASAA